MAHLSPQHMALLSFLAAAFFPASLSAATLVGIISERSAPELAAAASRFEAKHPGRHTLILRSTSQMDRMDASSAAELFDKADAILLASIFREDADRLVELLAAHPLSDRQTLIALHGDARLTRESQYGGKELFQNVSKETFEALTFRVASDRDPFPELARLAEAHPRQRPWLTARKYYLARGSQAWAELFAHLLAPYDEALAPGAVTPQPPIRFLEAGEPVSLSSIDTPFVAIVDYDAGDRRGDRELHEALSQAFTEEGLRSVSVLARWGTSTVEALGALQKSSSLVGLVVLQDFVLGGGGGREAAAQSLQDLDVPVFKGIRLVGRDELGWRLSDDGIPWDSVHYRVAMPELQGTGQPMVLAAAGPEVTDPLTGLKLKILEPINSEVYALARRAARWARLQTLPNSEKRVGIIYYNHPPGRHNIGADNLDVPASLMEILKTLKKAGYDVGTLPKSQGELLEALQDRGVNLPEDREALAALHAKGEKVSGKTYREYFAGLPTTAQKAMVGGPLHLLSAEVDAFLSESEGPGLLPPGGSRIRKLVDRTLEDSRHLLEGAQHPAAPRALDLLDQLAKVLERRLSGAGTEKDKKQTERLVGALTRTGIEGLRGWGPPPGKGMVHRDSLLVPGLRFGKVFIGPQPPRGWELDEELLHANLAFPPPHQYLAFYAWLKDRHRADVLVHLGRHSTYEFLPGRRLGLPSSDFPRLVVGDLPSVYIYVVDGVGEGIQAKRRGLATIVDHLTPSMSTTPLYDELLELRQLVESFESAEAGGRTAAQSRAIDAVKEKIRVLNLEKELTESMASELEARGIAFSEVDDELLVHEIGHYLTHLQERFMPYGLHVFGRDWAPDAVERMARSMAEKDDQDLAGETREALVASPQQESKALLAALSGRFVWPGKGNDPIRTPEALPTGRNFHALDGAILPTRVAWALGQELAEKARQERPGTPEGSEAVVLWASDTVRDEGAMMAFGLALLGLQPTWNSRGILKGLEVIPATPERPRRDVTFVTSGLFRDLYENLMVWLDRAVLLALSASETHIREAHPELGGALDGALERLATFEGRGPPGNEPLDINQLAAHWVASVQADLQTGTPERVAGRRASLRLFGNAPGGYGAGINRLAERSGAWIDRAELARAYLRRMGHAYGDGIRGEPAHTAFSQRLKRTEHSYLGRASNLYGLLDNNDGFDYLGGLGLAVESVRGQAPAARVIRHADPKNPAMQALAPALLGELRGRHLNPEYLKALKDHGYSGARTLSQGFVENLWGWQVTSPQIVKSWAWDEVHDVLIQDRHGIELDEFLKDGRNIHVLTNIEAILLVAASRNYWEADPETIKALAQAFAEQVLVHGLPGSGHTRPDHPVMTFIGAQLNPELRARFEAVLEAAKVDTEGPAQDPESIAEIQPESPVLPSSPWLIGGLVAAGIAAALFGVARGLKG